MIVLWLLGQAWGGTLIAEWGLEDTQSDFVSSGIPPQWECGEVLGGPGQGHSGSNACGTDLASNYGNNSNSMLRLPNQDLSGLDLPMLLWWNWYAFESGDSGVIEAMMGSEWVALTPVYRDPSDSGFQGQDTQWHPVVLDLTGLSNLAQVRFRLSSDSSVTDDGWFVDDFSLWDGDIAGPSIDDVTELEDTEDIPGPYVVTARVEDNVELSFVQLSYTVNDGEIVTLAMQGAGGDLFEGLIPGQSPDSDVAYWVEASDGVTVSRFPAEEGLDFRVRLPAPLELTGPEGLVHQTQATLSWEPPDTQLDILGYRLYQDGELAIETSDLESEVNLLGQGQDRFAVAAVFEAGEGEKSLELVLDTAVPKVVDFLPELVYQGDQIRGEVSAENLLFAQDDVEIVLGQGIVVTQIDVRDVDSLIVRIEVDSAALPGFRTADVESADFEVSLAEAVQVIDGMERPKITSLSPPVGRQGSRLELEIYTSTPIGEVYSVDIGEGVIVQEIHQPERNCIRVVGWIDENAPLGERMLTVDDGARIWTGQAFKVLDKSPAPVGCSATEKTAAWPLWAWAVLFLKRRRRRQIEK